MKKISIDRFNSYNESKENKESLSKESKEELIKFIDHIDLISKRMKERVSKDLKPNDTDVLSLETFAEDIKKLSK